MLWTYLILFLFVGTVVSWVAIQFLLKSKFSNLFCSESQPHHIHEVKTSRIGGVGIILGFIITYLLLFLVFGLNPTNQDKYYLVLIIGGLAAFLLGLIDDIFNLDAKLKFIAQVLIAFFAHEFGLSINRINIPFFEIGFLDLSSFSLILTVIWFVAIMNLINLIDGLDGLAGGVGLMLMVLLVFLNVVKGIDYPTFIALGMAGSLLGFLIHNFPPARVYMGDSGAYTIGFVIAGMSLMNYEKGAVIAALLGPMLAMALPILDVLFAILRRWFSGLPIFRPDKEHIHHKLLKTGLSHRNTVLVLYGISMFALLGGILIYSNQGRYFPLFIGFATILIILTIRFYSINGINIGRDFRESLSYRGEMQNAIKLSKWLVSEIDRVENAEDFSNDFKWFLMKLGFSKAILNLYGKEKEFLFDCDVSSKEFLVKEMKLNFGNSFIRLFGDNKKFIQSKFDISCDIAHQTFCDACKRWKDINDNEYNFDALAKPISDKSLAGSRKLYKSS